MEIACPEPFGETTTFGSDKRPLTQPLTFALVFNTTLNRTSVGIDQAIAHSFTAKKKLHVGPAAPPALINPVCGFTLFVSLDQLPEAFVGVQETAPTETRN